MKYLVILCDGLADEPILELGNKTILEYAYTPNLDYLAENGSCGFVQTAPEGFYPGSDVCNMSVFGYDPRLYYTGRSPLEAISMGIHLGTNDMSFRCNLVELSADYSAMIDFTAGHIDTQTSDVAIKRLNEIFKNEGLEFYTGVGYRHIMVVRNFETKTEFTPPHDIIDQKTESYLPRGQDANFFINITNKARSVFGSDTGKANSIWLWGAGTSPSFPSYEELYNKKGAVISAVDLIRGIGMCAGMKILEVPGITGFLDTNYKGKAEYALKAFEEKDYVYLHLESPDEAGHMGNIEYKIKAIEDIDKIVLPIVINGMKKFEEFRILVMPDHPTPVKLRTHTSNPVPALIYGTNIMADSNKAYCENIKPSFIIKDGYKVAKLLFD